MKNITALIKPSSHLCNLKCEYCFYCDEVNNRIDKGSSYMTLDTAENIIKKVYNYCDNSSNVNFMFQGGEPLLSGVEFFEFFSEKANVLNQKKLTLNFSLQTNGTLITEDYCKIFKKYNYLIGVSLDGPEEIHNMYRGDSYKQVISGIELLKKHSINFNIISVITSLNDPYKLFEFYVSNNFLDVQLIYCLDELNSQNSDYVLKPQELSRFKKRFFNKWISFLKSGNEMNVREFNNLAMYLRSGQYEQCGFLGKCTPQLVIESDGTVYPCDFYCLDDYKCLNINDCELEDLLMCDGMCNFINHTEPLNSLCASCEVKHLCNGGCKRYRSLYNSLGGYCPQRDFLTNSVPKLLDFYK